MRRKALNTSGWIEIEDFGYSNMMTLYDPGRHRGTDLYGTQIFLGERRDMSASGKPLKIDSYLVLVNTSDSWVSPHGELVYDARGQTNQQPLLIQPMGPHTSELVDFHDYYS